MSQCSSSSILNGFRLVSRRDLPSVRHRPPANCQKNAELDPRMTLATHLKRSIFPRISTAFQHNKDISMCCFPQMFHSFSTKTLPQLFVSDVMYHYICTHNHRATRKENSPCFELKRPSFQTLPTSFVPRPTARPRWCSGGCWRGGEMRESRGSSHRGSCLVQGETTN